MSQNRSADPWSTFLAPSGRGSGVTPSGAAPPRARGHAPGSGDEPSAQDACRRVLERLRAARGPLSLEQIHHSTRLGLLEVAEVVDTLRERGLVAVEREIDEVVRLTEG